jgi:hypothetical protein
VVIMATTDVHSEVTSFFLLNTRLSDYCIIIGGGIHWQSDRKFLPSRSTSLWVSHTKLVYTPDQK